MQFGEELCQFIQDCPTPFQFTQVASKLLIDIALGWVGAYNNNAYNKPKKRILSFIHKTLCEPNYVMV